MTQHLLLSDTRPVELAIHAWLQAVFTGRTQSDGTVNAYRLLIESYRRRLQLHRLDLDSAAAAPGRTDEAIRAADKALALIAQQWAAESRSGATLAPATIQHRYAVLASFFTHAKKAGVLETPNPIARLTAPRVQRYAAAVALTGPQLGERLAQIDRTTLAGLRDYALLLVGITTGVRKTALASIRRQDLALGPHVSITFTREKGGKVVRKTLDAATSRALTRYLDRLDAAGIAQDQDCVWVSTSRQNAGAALRPGALHAICEKWLDTGKVHTLRHSFAALMVAQGAPVQDIQEQLGHANLATTSVYVQRVTPHENPYAAGIAALVGAD